MPKELSVRDAMRVSGYSRNHLYNLIFAEKIRARKAKVDHPPGVAVYIDLESLQEYLETRGRMADVHLLQS